MKRLPNRLEILKQFTYLKTKNQLTEAIHLWLKKYQLELKECTRKLLLYIKEFTGSVHGLINHKQSTLAEETGLSVRSIGTALKQIKELAIGEVVETFTPSTRRKSSNVIFILPCADEVADEVADKVEAEKPVTARAEDTKKEGYISSFKEVPLKTFKDLSNKVFKYKTQYKISKIFNTTIKHFTKLPKNALTIEQRHGINDKVVGFMSSNNIDCMKSIQPIIGQAVEAYVQAYKDRRTSITNFNYFFGVLSKTYENHQAKINKLKKEYDRLDKFSNVTTFNSVDMDIFSDLIRAVEDFKLTPQEAFQWLEQQKGEVCSNDQEKTADKPKKAPYHEEEKQYRTLDNGQQIEYPF